MKENRGSIKLSRAVGEFYETHGHSFSRTRQMGWDVMRRIHDAVRAGMTLIDVGAGNARLSDSLPDAIRYVAIEPSMTLRREAEQRLARRKSSEIRSGGFPHLPAADGEADVAACIAVLHHIPTHKARRAAMHELMRIVKPGGTVFVTVWNLRSRRMFRSATWLAAWLRLPMVWGGECGDVWVPWNADGVQVRRYVHAFTRSELASLFNLTEWASVRVEDDGRNLFAVVVRK